MVYATGVGAVCDPPEKGSVLFVFQLILAVMKILLGHGAVVRRWYILVAFGLSAASALLHSNIILLTGIVPERNRIKSGPNRPYGSMAIG